MKELIKILLPLFLVACETPQGPIEKHCNDHDERAWMVFCNEDPQAKKPEGWTQWQVDEAEAWGIDNVYWRLNRHLYCCPCYTAMMYRQGGNG